MPSVIINNLFKINELVKLSSGDIEPKTAPTTGYETFSVNRHILFERKIIQIKCKYQVIHQFAKQNYFLHLHEGTGWDIYWTDRHFLSMRHLKSMMPYQRINYFPGMSILTNKQSLTQRLNLFRYLFPQDYDFFPTTWVVRKDSTTPIRTDIPTLLLTTPTSKSNSLQDAGQDISAKDTPESRESCDTDPRIGLTHSSENQMNNVKPLQDVTNRSNVMRDVPKRHKSTTFEKHEFSLEELAKDKTKQIVTKMTNKDGQFSQVNQDTKYEIIKRIEKRDINTKITSKNEQFSEENQEAKYETIERIEKQDVNTNKDEKMANKDEQFSAANQETSRERSNLVAAKKNYPKPEPYLYQTNQETKYEIMERIEKRDINKTDAFNINNKLKSLGIKTNALLLPTLRNTRNTHSNKRYTGESLNTMSQRQVLLKDNVRTMVMELNRLNLTNTTDDKAIKENIVTEINRTATQQVIDQRRKRSFNKAGLSDKDTNNKEDTETETDYKNKYTSNEIIIKEDTVTVKNNTNRECNEIINKQDIEKQENANKEIGIETMSKIDTESEADDTYAEVSSKNFDIEETDDTGTETDDTNEDVRNGTINEEVTGTRTDDTCEEVSSEIFEIEDTETAADEKNEIMNKENTGTATDDTDDELSCENFEIENTGMDTDNTNEDISDESLKKENTERDNTNEEISNETNNNEVTRTETDETDEEVSSENFDIEDIGTTDDTNEEIRHETMSNEVTGTEIDDTDEEVNSENFDIEDTGTESDDTNKELSDDSFQSESSSRVTTSAVVAMNPIYILKPCDGCQGKGIKLAMNIDQVVQSMEFDSMICQQYITNPLLWNGYKFDIRFYVLMTSVKQLRVYIYNEGIVRLATEKYEHPNESNIDNMFMHLTNYSINKNSENFSEDLSKLSLGQMNKFLREEHGVDTNALYDKIHDMIVKTVLAGYKPILREYVDTFKHHVYREACFQLLGFDVILDDCYNPYLLEINKNASLKRPTAVDKLIKTKLTRDLFSILNLNETRLRGDILRDNLSYSTYKKRYVEHELNNRGDFNLIYPCIGQDEYAKYMIDEINS